MTEPLDDPQVFLPDLFAAHARHDGGRDAVVCGEARMSWAAFDAARDELENDSGR